MISIVPLEDEYTTDTALQILTYHTMKVATPERVISAS